MNPKINQAFSRIPAIGPTLPSMDLQFTGIASCKLPKRLGPQVEVIRWADVFYSVGKGLSQSGPHCL